MIHYTPALLTSGQIIQTPTIRGRIERDNRAFRRGRNSNHPARRAERVVTFVKQRHIGIGAARAFIVVILAQF